MVELHERHQLPISLVGWSFGGLFARWLAHEHPDAVRQVVCLGSAWRPEGENISVPSSHVGLVSNPLALAAVEDRLAQDPTDPQPFHWVTCLERSVLGLGGPRSSRAEVA